ncbi:hypothetical protein Tmar_0890 [Thermaerobacter marianensis DSM 12885]|uniref:Uncharacterized protein n=1 Tax=Thermaerobacter marianensis (strain ATCC 700841 / DSM 12885 / JCM 10246 / 7p75a) TaxID=644966 RepID=E6SJ09_THEM7|nr:hypothetical protein Tmar_0890 [Thermaerobacter marianensis DSM 12885]
MAGPPRQGPPRAAGVRRVMVSRPAAGRGTVERLAGSSTGGSPVRPAVRIHGPAQERPVPRTPAHAPPGSRRVAPAPGPRWAPRLAGLLRRRIPHDRRHRAPQALLGGILHRLDELSWRWQRISIAEYLALFRDPGRLFWMNFVAGVARGLGAAVGFTLLGALVLLALQRAVELNLPYLGSLIADLLRIVRTELDGGTPGPGGPPPGP